MSRDANTMLSFRMTVSRLHPLARRIHKPSNFGSTHPTSNADNDLARTCRVVLTCSGYAKFSGKPRAEWDELTPARWDRWYVG